MKCKILFSGKKKKNVPKGRPLNYFTQHAMRYKKIKFHWLGTLWTNTRIKKRNWFNFIFHYLLILLYMYAIYLFLSENGSHIF